MLVVTDGGNGYACDWADWGEPVLTGPNGSVPLTTLKWTTATSDWGRVQVGRNAGGGPLRIGGTALKDGIGTHANSLIVFPLPQGHSFTEFRAVAGLDEGGTSQGGCGQQSSVQFFVATDADTARRLLARSAGSGASHDPEEAVAALDVHEGLQVTLSASEPYIRSLTNLDIDHRGRIWVCEVVNYRHNNGKRPEGDRILILTDDDHDGVIDRIKTYYQGRDVDSAMGICVLGNRVIVSASPNVIVFTDEDGDDRPDRKEYLFTKTGQPQHDHSVHSFVFGPDGKLYFNFGNTGRAVHDRHGKPVVDLAGNVVVDDGKPYFGGMVFRCDMDGSNFEVLAHNFRNNYEVAVDSFGTLWQSDNDDDGNRGVRINYVMEYGNYGYRDEMTGAGWRTPRIGMHPEIPRRHWHQNDPGVVPNLLQTGAGSPTGITVYEGRTLPQVFWDQIIHCDAGPNVVRSYVTRPSGAGYVARIVDLLVGTRDKWFRPADVCVAPDGSLFITDWYDPGVGGHRQGDIERGRLFRVAPPGKPYAVPRYDLQTIDGAIAALRSPNQAVRYLAWQKLHAEGTRAEPALKAVFDTDTNPRQRARALWLLGKIPGRGEAHVRAALADRDPDIRIVGIRLARQLGLPLEPIVAAVVRDPVPRVRRDAAIALRFLRSERADALWAELAEQYDGDRWYLEALGIGADLSWDTRLAAWLARVGSRWRTAPFRDIVWRSRSSRTPQLLAEILADPSLPETDVPRFIRAFDFQQSPQKNDALLRLAFETDYPNAQRRTLVVTEALKRVQGVDLGKNERYRAALERLLDQLPGRPEFIELVQRFRLADRYPELLELARQHPEDDLGVAATQTLLSLGQIELIERSLHGDPEQAARTLQALATTADPRANRLLAAFVRDDTRPLVLRRLAVRALGANRGGALTLVRMAEGGRLPPELKETAAAVLHAASWSDVKQQAARLFPLPPAKDARPLPPLTELAKRRGNPERGRRIFFGDGTCAKCHKVRGEGKDVGPDLSEIGSKLSRLALLESIVYPSAAISHNYETYTLALASGNVVSGILASETADAVTIKTKDGITRTFPRDEIETIKKENVSLMPADLQKTMTAEDLVDVVEFLTTLTKAANRAAAVN
ncbi:MAG: dehydrogenase [Planctomycetota bacterium]|nr:MAG: dehydrogenase [Planctomycetota bacterium]